MNSHRTRYVTVDKDATHGDNRIGFTIIAVILFGILKVVAG